MASSAHRIWIHSLARGLHSKDPGVAIFAYCNWLDVCLPILGRKRVFIIPRRQVHAEAMNTPQNTRREFDKTRESSAIRAQEEWIRSAVPLFQNLSGARRGVSLVGWSQQSSANGRGRPAHFLSILPELGSRTILASYRIPFEYPGACSSPPRVPAAGV